MNTYLDLFLTFSRVGVCTFGGGYAMLPILQREVVDKKSWISEDELADCYAIGQCTPGVIAVNTATFVGYRQKGNSGGMIATLGVVFPSIVIIMVIAAFLQNFADIPAVGHAFSGVRACVCALIASSVLKLRKNTVIDKPTLLFSLLFFCCPSFPAPWQMQCPRSRFWYLPWYWSLSPASAGSPFGLQGGGRSDSGSPLL